MIKIIILALYGIALLIIGIISATRIKNPSDFFIAGKKTGVLQISGSLLATILGGSAILGTINLCETQSWAASWYILAASIGLVGLLPIAKKVNSLGKFTLPQLIGQFYGETARKVTSIVIPIAWLGIIAAQIIAGAQILVSFFSMQYETGVFITGLIFIIYTFIGGQISILKTDFIQSIIILAGLLLTAFILPASEADKLPELSSVFPFNNNFTPFDLFILLITFSTTFVVGPDIYSRVFCAKDTQTAQFSVLIVLLILIPIAIALAYIGVFAAHHHPVDGGSALVNIINVYLPDWIAGIFVAALISAVLSSADTTLLTASMIITELINKDIDNRRSLLHTKYFIFLIGVISMLISFYVSSIITSLLLALTFYSAAFIIPMAAALFNMPYNKKYFIAAMLSGGIIALLGKILYSIYNIEFGKYILISGFIINAILLFIPVNDKMNISKHAK